MPAASFRRDRRQSASSIRTLFRAGKRTFIEIRRQNTHRRPVRVEALDHGHRQGIRFLTRGRGGGPEARLTPLPSRSKCMIGRDVEVLRVTEESGKLRGQETDKTLFGVRLPLFSGVQKQIDPDFILKAQPAAPLVEQIPMPLRQLDPRQTQGQPTCPLKLLI
jgi:hypothetical protein